MKINIPDELYKTVEDRAQQKGFKSAEAYVVFALEKLIGNDKKSQKTYSDKEEAVIKKRLEDLGYLD